MWRNTATICVNSTKQVQMAQRAESPSRSKPESVVTLAARAALPPPNAG